MARHGSPAQLALFEATRTRRRRRRYVPTYDHHSPEVIRHANETAESVRYYLQTKDTGERVPVPTHGFEER